MTHRTLLLPPPKPLRIIPAQNPPITFLQLENILINLMRWQQKHLPRTTTQHILLIRLSELNIVGSIGAEDHHVGEISSIFQDLLLGWGGGFSEDAAGGEDGLDCLDDDAC
jgi:hypothetical protein